MSIMLSSILKIAFREYPLFMVYKEIRNPSCGGGNSLAFGFPSDNILL